MCLLLLLGVGILSMPYAVAQGGWTGLSFLLIFAVVCCYTGVLLRRCIDLDPSIMGYPDVGQVAFGKYGRIIVSALLYFELFAVSAEFLILEGRQFNTTRCLERNQIKVLWAYSRTIFHHHLIHRDATDSVVTWPAIAIIYISRGSDCLCYRVRGNILVWNLQFRFHISIHKPG